MYGSYSVDEQLSIHNIALAGKAVLLTEAYNVYPQSLQTKSGIELTLIHDRFLSNDFQIF